MNRIKEEKKYIVLSLLGSLLPVFFGLALYKKLPDPMAVHFNQFGEADGYASRMQAILVPGLLFPLLNLLTVWIIVSDPKSQNIGKRVFRLILWIVPVVAAFTGALIYGNALISGFDNMRLVCLFIGVLFLFIGNYLPKCRQNYSVGIRNAWTLNDAEIWDRTHRLGGYVEMICGFAMIILAFVGSKYRFAFIMATVVIGGMTPYLYSYFLYRKKKES